MKIDNIEYSKQIEILKNQINSKKIENIMTKDTDTNDSESDFSIQIAGLKTQLDEERLYTVGKESMIIVLQEKQKKYEDDLNIISELKMKNSSLESDLQILKSKLLINEKNTSVLISDMEDMSSMARYVFYLYLCMYLCV
jgi:hypothetical protein